MNLATQLATATMAAWTTSYLVVAGVALVRASRRRTPPPRHASGSPEILLVRPCTGDDATLLPALRSTASVRHATGQLRILLTVDQRCDPAWPHVGRAAAWLREHGMNATAIVAATTAYNRKVGQLATATRSETADVLVCVDADIDLTDFDLDAFVRPLISGRAGAVWAPPVETGRVQGFGDRASAAVLGASLHAFNLLGELDESGLVGKTFAVRGDALRAVGGFAELGSHLGEDMELARRLRQQGWHTTMHRRSVRALSSGRSWKASLARYTRWLWVIRAQRPTLLATYPLLIAAAPLLLVALAILALWAPSWAGILAGVVLTTRVAIALGAAVPRGRLAEAASFEWLIADVLLLAAFVRALGRPEVTWRDRTLRLGPGGRLQALEATTSLRPAP